jgi:hypothetical protein
MISSVSVPVVLKVWFVHVPAHVPASAAGVNFFGVAAVAEEAPTTASSATRATRRSIARSYAGMGASTRIASPCCACERLKL